MAREHHAKIQDRFEGEFQCRRCGTRAHASYMATGVGVVRETIFTNRGEAQVKAARDADDDLVADADRILRYLRCPKCRRRNPGTLLVVQLLVATCAIIGIAAAVSLHGDPQQAFPIGAGLIILLAIAATHGRLRRADAATLTVRDPARPPAPIEAPPVAPRAVEERPVVLG